jgi:hypothetical protein
MTSPQLFPTNKFLARWSVSGSARCNMLRQDPQQMQLILPACVSLLASSRIELDVLHGRLPLYPGAVDADQTLASTRWAQSKDPTKTLALEEHCGMHLARKSKMMHAFQLCSQKVRYREHRMMPRK